jgi:hypothetical protein
VAATFSMMTTTMTRTVEDGYFCYCFFPGFPNTLSEDVADNDGAEEEGDNCAEHESLEVTQSWS